MEKSDELRFLIKQDAYLLLNNNMLFRYSLGSGKIGFPFNLDKLINDNPYYNSIIDLGFTYYNKISFNVNENRVQYTPVSVTVDSLKEYKKENSTSENDIVIYNEKITTNDIQSLYELELEIEVKGIRTKFDTSAAYNDKIYVRIPKDNESLRLKYTEIFGDPEVIPELADDKYGTAYWSRFFIIDKNDIDKIIGIKRYMNTASFGQDVEEYTGQTEEITLDLNNFNEDIYHFFKEHKMLEIEGYSS